MRDHSYLSIALAAVGYAVLCFSPATVKAEVVKIRSGEHETFTRIVLDFAERPGWSIDQVSEGYELSLEASSITFDLGDVYRRIGRNRIQRLVDAGDGVLQIITECTCHLAVEMLENQGLVIDVKDGAPDQTNQAGVTFVDNDIPQYFPMRKMLSGAISELSQRYAVDALTESLSLNEGLDKRVAFRDLQEKLLRKVERAEFQGLISMQPIRPDTQLSVEQVLKEGDHDGGKNALDAPRRQTTASANIRVETQADRDEISYDRNGFKAEEKACIDRSAIDISRWFPNEDVLGSIGRARLNLLDGQGRMVPQAYADLARRLIYLSFGAEARVLLQAAPDNTPNHDLLVYLATAMEGDVSNVKGDVMADHQNCGELSLLWSLLAGKDLSENDGKQLGKLIQLISSLPIHLRKYLGPRVARSIVDSGDQDAAVSILNAAMRGSSSELEYVAVLDAQIGGGKTNQYSKERGLEAVVRSNGALAAEALIALIERQIESGREVDNDLILQASALGFEFGASTVGEALASVVIEALLHNGQFDQIFEEIRDLSRRDRMGQKMLDGYRSTALAKLSDLADDVTFLSIAPAQIQTGNISASSRISTASRFLKLGLPRLARKALGSEGGVPQERERYLLAEIAILEEDYDTASSYLVGLDGDAVAALQDRISKSQRVSDRLELSSEMQQSIGDVEHALNVDVNDMLDRARDLVTESRSVQDESQSLLRGN